MFTLRKENQYLKIKDWHYTDRPREKLLLKGASSLTNAELLAILIGSGVKSMSAVDLAKHILLHYNSNLNKLSKSSIKELQNFKGIGKAKAITIASAFELAKRKFEISINSSPIVNCSQKAYNIIKPNLCDKITEEFWVILLNKSKKFIAKKLISKGGFSDTVVDPKIIFKQAFIENASNIILVHNHPSGNVNPSEDDIIMTNKLFHGAKILDLEIIDHIIFSDFEYFSFADEELI
ncbi:MAG: DNA repair protein RadC [Bacteroidetes bacterium]|nr:DNA repair protein RadC [Bacteroidota bacterium]